MGELTQCNYCSLKDIKRRAKEKGQTVTIRYGLTSEDGTKLDPGGKEVFVEGKWIAWFMELTDHCVC